MIFPPPPDKNGRGKSWLLAPAIFFALDRVVVTGAASHEEATLRGIAIVVGAVDGMARMVPDFSGIAGTDAVTLMAVSPLPGSAIGAVTAIARIGLSVGSDRAHVDTEKTDNSRHREQCKSSFPHRNSPC
jgi:hypothetical protein